MEITPVLHSLRLQFGVPVAPGITVDRFVNVYILYGETLTLIDSGVAGCGEQIFDSIRSHGRDPLEIGRILLTHSHPDHIGAAREIQEATGCSIAAHPAEREWIEDVHLQSRERPVPGFDTLVGGSVHLDRLLQDGELIESYDNRTRDMRVLHTPGHSPGSLSFFIPGQGVLFSGDAIPVWGDLPVYDDPLASVQSVKRLRGLPGISLLLPAWDEPRGGEEAYRLMDNALTYLQKIHEAVHANGSPGSLDEMERAGRTAAALGLPPGVLNPLFARTCRAHLRFREKNDLLSS